MEKKTWKRFYVRYKTRNSMGWARYSYENEMYADLEVQGLTEENPDVLGIDYYAMDSEGNLRRWDFGKPYVDDLFRKYA